MSKKDAINGGSESQKVTKEQMLRMREVRKGLKEGIISSQVPAPRSGMMQYVSTEKKLRKKLSLGYTQRTDDDGTPMYVEDNAGKKMPIMEIPTELWDDAIAEKNRLASEAVEQLKNSRVRGSDSEFFDSAGELSRGSEKFKS